MEVFDILLDENYAVRIEGGDLLVGESTKQHQNLLLISNPGEWKQNPTIGIGIGTYLLDDAPISDLKAAIQKGFENDGMIISVLRIDSDYNLQIAADYGK